MTLFIHYRRPQYDGWQLKLHKPDWPAVAPEHIDDFGAWWHVDVGDAVSIEFHFINVPPAGGTAVTAPVLDPPHSFLSATLSVPRENRDIYYVWADVDHNNAPRCLPTPLVGYAHTYQETLQTLATTATGFLQSLQPKAQPLPADASAADARAAAVKVRKTLGGIAKALGAKVKDFDKAVPLAANLDPDTREAVQALHALAAEVKALRSRYAAYATDPGDLRKDDLESEASAVLGCLRTRVEDVAAALVPVSHSTNKAYAQAAKAMGVELGNYRDPLGKYVRVAALPSDRIGAAGRIGPAGWIGPAGPMVPVGPASSAAGAITGRGAVIKAVGGTGT